MRHWTPHLLSAASWEKTLLLNSLEPLLAPKRHTHSRLRCSNLSEDKQKRLTLNSCCTHPLQAGIITPPGWDTAKKRTTRVKLLQVVYLLSLILPCSDCVFLRAEPCLSLSLPAVWDLPRSPRAETICKSPPGSPAPRHDENTHWQHEVILQDYTCSRTGKCSPKEERYLLFPTD